MPITLFVTQTCTAHANKQTVWVSGWGDPFTLKWPVCRNLTVSRTKPLLLTVSTQFPIIRRLCISSLAELFLFCRPIKPTSRLHRSFLVTANILEL